MKTLLKMRNTSFQCNYYNQLREKLFTKARAIKKKIFLHMHVNDQFKILMSEKLVKDTAEFLYF